LGEWEVGHEVAAVAKVVAEDLVGVKLSEDGVEVEELDPYSADRATETADLRSPDRTGSDRTPAQICGDLSRFAAIQALVPETSKAYKSLAKPLETRKPRKARLSHGG
jgi:hypothetical protein